MTHRERLEALPSSANATPFGSPASTANFVPGFDVNDDDDDSSLDECTSSQVAASASTATSPPAGAEASRKVQ
jgi:hypothetical protein